MARATLKRCCPLLEGGVCREINCAWYLGEQMKGDCAIHVLAVRHKIQLDDVKENNHLKRLGENLRKMDTQKNKEEVEDIQKLVVIKNETSQDI
jgi:hypothetical protein